MGYLGLDAVMKVAPVVLTDYGLQISYGVEVVQSNYQMTTRN